MQCAKCHTKVARLATDLSGGYLVSLCDTCAFALDLMGIIDMSKKVFRVTDPDYDRALEQREAERARKRNVAVEASDAETAQVRYMLAEERVFLTPLRNERYLN